MLVVYYVNTLKVSPYSSKNAVRHKGSVQG